jgi:hypothetical protein
MNRMAYKNALKDMLHGLSKSSNPERINNYQGYYRGMIIGCITGLMHTGINYDNAMKLIQDNLPEDCISLNGIILPHERIGD